MEQLKQSLSLYPLCYIVITREMKETVNPRNGDQEKEGNAVNPGSGEQAG